MLNAHLDPIDCTEISGNWFVRALNCPSFIVRVPTDGTPRDIGRGHDCDIRIPDRSISRRHCRIDFRDALIQLSDLKSRNGIIVEGKRVNQTLVRSGQLVRLGEWDLLFTFETSTEESTTQNAAPEYLGENLIESLTPAQRRVAILLLEEHTERKMADLLSLSYFTIHNHVKEIYRKYHVQSRRQFIDAFQMHMQSHSR